jgi:hypothetical protein
VWYVANQGLRTYFLLIVLTVWVVLLPKSSIVWRVFENLPSPPLELAEAFGI